MENCKMCGGGGRCDRGFCENCRSIAPFDVCDQCPHKPTCIK
jgi:hypothetical protein